MKVALRLAVVVSVVSRLTKIQKLDAKRRPSHFPFVLLSCSLAREKQPTTHNYSLLSFSNIHSRNDDSLCRRNHGVSFHQRRFFFRPLQYHHPSCHPISPCNGTYSNDGGNDDANGTCDLQVYACVNGFLIEILSLTCSFCILSISFL